MPDKIENVNGSVPAETENEGIGSGRVESGTEGVGERLSENAENESSVVADRAESGEKIDYESASLDEVMQNVEERLTLPDTDNPVSGGEGGSSEQAARTHAKQQIMIRRRTGRMCFFIVAALLPTRRKPL